MFRKKELRFTERAFRNLVEGDDGLDEKMRGHALGVIDEAKDNNRVIDEGLIENAARRMYQDYGDIWPKKVKDFMAEWRRECRRISAASDRLFWAKEGLRVNDVEAEQKNIDATKAMKALIKELKEHPGPGILDQVVNCHLGRKVKISKIKVYDKYVDKLERYWGLSS